VHPGQFCRRKDLLRGALLIKAADIGFHGSVKEFDVLRQVADIAAEHLRRPLIDRCSVVLDGTAGGHPDADQRSGQG